MQHRFSSGISPLKYKKRMLFNSSALLSTFRRVNSSLAGCSSAEPVSVSVREQNSILKTIFTNCQKSQPRSQCTKSNHHGYNISCFGAQDGTIHLDISGGTPP